MKYQEELHFEFPLANVFVFFGDGRQKVQDQRQMGARSSESVQLQR